MDLTQIPIQHTYTTVVTSMDVLARRKNKTQKHIAQTRRKNTEMNMHDLQAAGYKVVVMRECEFSVSQNIINEQYITPRTCLSGGHTEVFRRHVEATHTSTIEYDDVVSLYPTCNTFDVYPVGKPHHYNATTPLGLRGIERAIILLR